MPQGTNQVAVVGAAGAIGHAVGAALEAYRVPYRVIYPAISVLTGHSYPRMPTFGLPCPSAVFTIGVLTLAKPHLPRLVLLVPALWCAVGVQAAFLVGVPQDLALGAAGLTGVWLMLGRTRGPAR
jgi:hypothetical protein